MKSGKVIISVGIGLIVVIIIIYLVMKNGSSTPAGISTNPLLANGSNVLGSNAFQTILTGANSTWQSLFNSQATSGAYNITLPSYISSTPITSTNANAPTLDLQYMPKGCTIDNYLAGNC